MRARLLVDMRKPKTKRETVGQKFFFFPQLSQRNSGIRFIKLEKNNWDYEL